MARSRRGGGAIKEGQWSTECGEALAYQPEGVFDDQNRQSQAAQ